MPTGNGESGNVGRPRGKRKVLWLPMKSARMRETCTEYWAGQRLGPFLLATFNALSGCVSAAGLAIKPT